MISAERVSELQDMVLRGDDTKGQLTEEEKQIADGCSAAINSYMNGLRKLIRDSIK